MSYCTNQDVIDITGTDLSTAIIDRIIEAADRKVNRYLRQNGLSTSPSPTPDDVKDSSIYFSAGGVLNRHMVDGTLPAQYKAENMSEKTDVKTVIANYERDAVIAITMYAGQYAEDADMSMFRVVGRDGERVGEYEAMTEEEEDLT